MRVGAESPRVARANFVLEDYRATQQSLLRHDASIVTMRNWMVVTVMAYYGLVGTLAEAIHNEPTRSLPCSYLVPPLAL